ncbi:Type 4 prepilin-like proteins leader peptide-processing enzyme [bioreactor metagenome]|uniref:Type 4 prepilin-like proteins leader peptide-processing enzyme n=1 Tax=bioreactor metagenome TaxID=1076179 RepID=A0A645I504_9ZZZZ
MIDIDTMEIYDRFQIMLGCLAIISLFISPLPFTDHLIGFFIISGPFLLIAYLTNGIGGGDIKLIAVCGFLLGYQATIVAFFFASVIGGIIAVLLLATKQKDRKSQIAFGPYLCIGVALAYLYGLPIMNWYLSLMF